MFKRKQHDKMVEEILFVVHTMRGESVRMISARLATEQERKEIRENMAKAHSFGEEYRAVLSRSLVSEKISKFLIDKTTLIR